MFVHRNATSEQRPEYESHYYFFIIITYTNTFFEDSYNTYLVHMALKYKYFPRAL